MEKLKVLQFCVYSIFCFFGICECQLRPGGINVKVKYEDYYVREATNTKTTTGRTTCSNTCNNYFLWWCTGYRRVCKTIYSSNWKTVYKSVKKTRKVYICKTGWIAKGTECPTPICTGGCQNGGKCTSPNTCLCAAGWTGSLCNSDINECVTSQNACEYKPGCINTYGSYTCSCSSGYYLQDDQRSCEDIDECIAYGNYSCGANSRCVNVPGNYSCPCLNGFGILSPSNVCEDIDECDPSSGFVHGCQMGCDNIFGGYSCTCRSGFNLTSNGKDCSDHDECKTNGHACEQICINLPGKFQCACSNGFRLNTGDSKTCDDINECSENISGCAQDCTNTIGGFNCSCRKGYKLGSDRLSCIDIDECSKPVDYCHHICSNIPGSYTCSCRAGFVLHLDGKSCIGLPCFPIYTPVNGMKNCSGYNTEDRCNFKCLRGYDLTGSTKRTCSSNKLWTGNDTECKIIHCAKPKVPQDGFVYSPCATHFRSQCSVGCNDGYYMDSDVITCDENGLWQPTNVSCEAIEVCRPNPCRHGGNCSIVDEASYACDCSNTAYKGTSCEVAYFNIFDYPSIYPNVLSPPITIMASQPANQVLLQPINRDLEFTPSVIVFDRSSSLNQSIQVKAKQEGVYFIRYSLSGPSAGEYSLPKDDILFVSSRESINNDSKIENSIDNFPVGCHQKQVGVVRGSNLPIMISSTSPFVPFGPLSVTEGIVGIDINNSTKLPLSIVGVNLPNTSIITHPVTCVDSDFVPYSTGPLLRSRVLAKSFVGAIKNSLPTWVKITLSESNSVKTMYSSERETHFLTGTNMRKTTIAKGLPIDDESFYSMLSTNNLNITVQNDSDIFKSESVALAVDLGQPEHSDVLLSSTSEVNVIKDISTLRQIKKYGWNFEFYTLQLSRNNAIKRPEKNGFWDGNEFFNVKSSSDGSFAAVLSLKKHFKNSTFADDIRMEFDGTIIGHVEDLNQILDFPLYQKWNVDLYGSIAFTVLFKIEGKNVRLRFKGKKSVNYALFGDHNKDEAHQGKSGFFLTTIMEKDPFFNTSFEKYLGMSSNRTISCFLDTALYKEKNNFHHTEISDGLSCAFNAILKVGDLQFRSMQINLRMGRLIDIGIKGDNSVELIGTYTESKNETFGIFKRYPDMCTNVRCSISQHSTKFVASFCATSNILGVEQLSNISISYEGLRFKTSGKLHGLFDASMDCSSRLLSWGNQIFDVVGRFERNIDGADFITALEKKLTSFARNVISQATRRMEAVNLTVERAHARLDKVRLLKAKAINKVQQLRIKFTSVSENLRTAQNRLKSLEIQAKNYSKDLSQLKSDLDGMCKINQCPNVCHKGISCTTCYEYIIGDSMGTCPATCSRTYQRLVPPFSEVAYCSREKCTRIHSTVGFFKRVFGKAFGGLVKGVLSFGITVVATVFGAPPPLAGAIGGGVTTFLDTGRVDEAVCASIRGAIGGAIGGKSSLDDFKRISTKTAVSTGRKAASLSYKSSVTCQREQKDGEWRCRVEHVQCLKGRYEYEYTHIPYTCKKSCVVEKISRKIEKSCCKNASCASFVLNITCVAENVLCKKARVDALQKISKTQSEGVNVLRNLEYTKSNISLWNMKKQRLYGVLAREQRWLNTTSKAVKNLEKAYSRTVESRENLDNLLSAPLRIKALFNETLGSLDGIKLKEVRFETKVFPKDDSKLLPIAVTFQANGTQRRISTVLDFSQLNISLRSISEEILFDVIGNIYSHSRRRRSVNIPTVKTDPLLYSLKKYHTYCAYFKSYHAILYNVAISLHKLSTEIVAFEKELSHREQTSLNLTDLPAISQLSWNHTASTNFTIDDPEMSEAFELELEEKRKNYEDFNSTNKLLVQNWFAAMEDMFNASRLHYECSGMKDCMIHILDSLVQMFSVIESERAGRIRLQLQNLETELDGLLNSFDISIDVAVNVSSRILNVLNEMAELEEVCAQSPNITRHPNPVINLTAGKDLVLYCNATGTAIIYSWTFNGEVIPNQRSNLLIIKNTTISNSGNYTCFVSNHIAKEKSIPAVVTIHPPPIITAEPEKYLAIVIGENDDLQCKVDETIEHVSHEWWFKHANSSTFKKLYNENGSYLGFSPMRHKHEGWYFCRVSNSYGVSSSRVSFVKALSFTLPVPSAVLSFLLIKQTGRGNFSVELSNSTGYDVIKHYILSKMFSQEYFGDGISVENLRPFNCKLSGKSKKDTEVVIGMCSWEFQYVGKNMTSNVTVHDDFKINAEKVINASQEIHEGIKWLVTATNNGSFSFSMADKVYFAEKNSMAVRKFSLVCPKSQVLVQNDLKCADCPPGYYAKLNDEEITSCIPCPLGFYQTGSGEVTCNKCPKGFSTWSEGSYEHSQCKVICEAGHYGVVNKGIGYCFPCPKNEYQPHEGELRCIRCPKNHVTKTEGASDLRQCLMEEIELPTTGAADEATTPRKTRRDSTTKRSIIKGATTRGATTKAGFDEIGGDDDEKSQSLTIGLSLGISFFVLIAIGIAIFTVRKKSLLAPKESQKGIEQLKAEAEDNPATVSSFANAIYDDASVEHYENPDEHFHTSRADLDSSESNGNPSEKVLGFRNDLFQRMSGEIN